MKKIGAGDPETHSADIVGHNIETLKQLFPEAVTEGKIDFDVLRQLLSGEIDDKDEKYGLNWHGKKRARQLALTPSTGTLRPCPEESVDWDTTQNLMIEGDNLEVLKLLQKSYAGKVKLIYIDPPYNTGTDRIYPDSYQDNIANYLMLTGQVESDGRAISTSSESQGRFHTDWLDMLYPRLILARNLLRPDGVLFVSIDDHEVANLRKLCDEVFGEENFVSTVIWQKKYSTKADSKYLSESHEFILVVARSIESLRIIGLARSEEQESIYQNPDNDVRGPWTSDNLLRTEERDYAIYEIVGPTGRKFMPPKGSSWRFNREKIDVLISENRIWFGKDGSSGPRLKRFRADVRERIPPQTIWGFEEVGHTDEGTKELADLFGGTQSPFPNPKPTRLIERMLEITCDGDDLVLDFFAGSGTTAHGAMKQAAEGQRRRFILVQLPELLSSDDKGQKIAAEFCESIGQRRSIAELTKERLRRAGTRIKGEAPMFSGDLGFRVFKLASSNLHAWEAAPSDLPSSLEAAVEHLKIDRTEADILYELLLKLGLDLCVPIEKREIAGKDVHAVGGGVLLACLTTTITKDDAEPLALGIIEWHRTLATAGDTTCVFRDSAFEDDVAKTNVAKIIEQYSDSIKHSDVYVKSI